MKKPQYGLTDEEVEKMLLDSITHAKEDIQTRALVEAQTEAQQILDTTRMFVEKNKAFFLPEEVSLTEVSMKNLVEKMSSADKDAIQAAIEKLNEISRPYAERLMDHAISTPARRSPSIEVVSSDIAAICSLV